LTQTSSITIVAGLAFKTYQRSNSRNKNIILTIGMLTFLLSDTKKNCFLSKYSKQQQIPTIVFQDATLKKIKVQDKNDPEPLWLY
jgi:hypothetical protein